jgi:hypothetical protein
LSEWKVGQCISTLAAAYAESGDFASAVKWATSILNKAPARYREKLREQIALYESGKPYRDEPNNKK